MTVRQATVVLPIGVLLAIGALLLDGAALCIAAHKALDRPRRAMQRWGAV